MSGAVSHDDRMAETMSRARRVMPVYDMLDPELRLQLRGRGDPYYRDEPPRTRAQRRYPWDGRLPNVDGDI